MSYNIGSAILITSIMWFGYHYGFSTPLLLLGTIPVLTWAYAGFRDERKDLLLAQIRYYNARARYFESESRELERKHE